jgi:hypothetical protein
MTSGSRTENLGRHERRIEQRHQSVMKAAAVHSFGGQSLCIIRDMSENGLKLRTFRPFAPGTTVLVELQPNDAMSGVVVWATDGEMGVKLYTPLDVAFTLKPPGGRRLRFPRFEVDCPVVARFGARTVPGRLRNISTGGVALAVAPGRKLSGTVTLNIPDLPPHNGTVQWNDEDRIGLSFNRRLDVEALAAWIEQHQEFLGAGRWRSRCAQPAGPKVASISSFKSRRCAYPSVEEVGVATRRCHEEAVRWA